MLKRFWPRRSRAGASGAGPVDSVELRHVDGAVAEQVRAFFAGRIPEFSTDGDRSVRFTHPFKPGVEIKIKGAGFQGGFIQFGTLHNTGPKAPVFDYDGRMMEDVASGHDNAFEGGASFQQAATEYRTTQRLASLGYPVVPCLGFGRVEKAGLVSWFSVFEVQSDWAAVSPPKFSLDEYCEAELSGAARSRCEARSYRLRLVCRGTRRTLLHQGSAPFPHG